MKIEINASINPAEDNKITLFSIEAGNRTWYVDYDKNENKYDVHKDEIFKVRRSTLGEALEFIFNSILLQRMVVRKNINLKHPQI